MIKTQALMCEQCFTVHHNAITIISHVNGEFGDIYTPVYCHCDKCNETTYHFSLDDAISDLMSAFNKNGFVTEFSCEGHLTFHDYNDDKNFSISTPYFVIDNTRSTRKFSKAIIKSLIKAKFIHLSLDMGRGLQIEKTKIADTNLSEINRAKRVSFYMDSDYIHDMAIHFSVFEMKLSSKTRIMIDYAIKDWLISLWKNCIDELNK